MKQRHREITVFYIPQPDVSVRRVFVLPDQSQALDLLVAALHIRGHRFFTHTRLTLGGLPAV